MTIVAFQGEHGAYSEEAVRQHFGPDVEPLPCRAFEHIFKAIETGKADYGALPIENSTAGSINKAFDLLLDRDLRVSGEIKLHVRHSLMTLPENVGHVREIRSHHQALAQCETYLNRHGYRAVPWYDTSGAAKDLAAEPAEGVAVIASKLAAKYHNLEIIDEGIEDIQNNYTRFFVVGKDFASRTSQAKTSVVFAVPDTPRALFAVLREFAERDINLTKLESRPRRNRPWQYVFYVDFDGHYQDDHVKDALVGALSHSAFLKLLGSYPAAEVTQAGVEEEMAQEVSLQI
ncbi:MAG: prephenate dehydratase [Chloroflexota bacterium]